MRRVGLIALLVVSCVTLAAQGQNASPQFRAGVELLQLDVVVLDDKRQPVRGLTAADFTVLDDGLAAPIRAFTPVEIVSERHASDAVWAGSVPPDVVTNEVGAQDGRLVVILMDRSIPLESPTVTARKIATAAVDALGPNDLAAVVSTFNGAVQSLSVQNLTADRSQLLRAINASDPATSISDEALVIMNKGFLNIDPLNDPRCLCGVCVPETIERVADALQNLPRRRKVLLFIGSNVIWQVGGADTSASNDPGCANRIKDARVKMMTAVDRANLTVHSIDPQGLLNIGPQTRASVPGGLEAAGSAGRRAAQQAETNKALTAKGNLEVLPQRTGGRAVVGQNDPERVVPAIFRESEAYYVLGIERGLSSKPDGSRSIEVKVGRRGLRVYSQRQYNAAALTGAAASASAKPASSQDALSRLLPFAGAPLALAATAFAAPAGQKAIVRLDVDAASFAHADGSPAPLDVAILATNHVGQQVASARQTSTITKPREIAQPQEINIQSQLELEPGSYGIRVAVSDPQTGTVASVFSDVAIPAFHSAALSLSSVALDIATAAGSAPASTTRRTFKRSDRVRALLQIYEGTERTTAITPVSMRVQILDAKGTAVRDQSLPFTEQTFTNRRADCVITLPLAQLPAGEYLLKLEASMARETAGRALRFTIE